MARSNELPSFQTLCRDGPVFIYCLPRVGSTWLGYKFADCSKIAFRFEPFHENLLAGTHQSLQKAFERLRFGRSLRHPYRARHYHNDYRFRTGGGVELFQKRFCYQNYYMDSDQPDEPLKAYLTSILSQAHKGGRRPCVKCTRSALRVRWLSSHFPGTYIYLFRSPRLMDNSHFSFRGYCNPYIRDYALIIGQNGFSRLFTELANWSRLDSYIGCSLEEEYAHYRKILWQGRKGQYNRQFHFDCLCFFWTIALAEASRFADLIIDMDNLTVSDLRERTEAKIHKLTGTKVDLSNYRVDTRRLRRILARHRLTVSGEMVAIIRSVLKWLEPDWDRALRFTLTDQTKEAIRFIDCRRVSARGQCRDQSNPPGEGQNWHCVF